jgi:hypothetical protein
MVHLAGSIVEVPACSGSSTGPCRRKRHDPDCT